MVFVAILCVTLVLSCLGAATAHLGESTSLMLVVNTTGDTDDGRCNATHCSLREAINAANNRAGPDMITFDPTVFPMTKTEVVRLSSSLPAILDGNTTIDASDANVTIDGGNVAFLGIDARGLDIHSSGNTVKGIRITGFPSAGITLTAHLTLENRLTQADDNTLMNVEVVSNGYGPPPFTGREDGIMIEAQGAGSSACRNRVVNSTIENNADDGIILQARDGGTVDYNLIVGNVIRGNGEIGVELDAGENGPAGYSVSHNTIRDNTVEENEEGAISVLGYGHAGRHDDNLIYRNNFIKSASTQPRHHQDHGNNTSWDHGGEGNYWSDYLGVDEDGDGIGDSPYHIPPNGADHYPLMAPIVTTSTTTTTMVGTTERPIHTTALPTQTVMITTTETIISQPSPTATESILIVAVLGLLAALAFALARRRAKP